MSQPVICQDIAANLYNLLKSFTDLQRAPNTSFSHSNGFQQLETQPQSPDSAVSQVEQILQWFVIGAFVLILIVGQTARMRQNQDLKPNRQSGYFGNHNGGQGGIH